jgi:hypothetical protein
MVALFSAEDKSDFALTGAADSTVSFWQEVNAMKTSKYK